MNNFTEWLKERDPEIYSELFGDLKKGFDKFRVGLKRAGERTEKLLGGDPHSRQRGNRQNSKDKSAFGAILKDL